MKFAKSRFSSLFALSLVLGAASVEPCRADLLFYTPGGLVVSGSRRSPVFMIQGKSSRNAKSYTFIHPRYGKMVFGLDEVEIKIAPSNNELFGRQMGKAKGNADKLMEAALWALHHGMLDQYHTAIDEAIKADPKHEKAKQAKTLRAQVEQPVPETEDARVEKELRDFCSKKTMEIQKSKHFMLLHDTPKKPGKFSKKTRAEERLGLLEKVYESFLMTFYSQGVPLEIPKERMKVILFEQYEDYKTFSVAMDADLIHALGYWSPTNNISVFFDHGSTEEFKLLTGLAKELARDGKEAVRAKASNAKDVVRLANALEIIVQVRQEGEDIKVVSHEATHQMAGNTGLFPRRIFTPRWVHEGLAAYFECPSDAEWSGIGAVNPQRLEDYKLIHSLGSKFSSIDYVVGDAIFKRNNDPGLQYMAYGQAWAMTHFMMSEHFPEFIAFYRRLGEMPSDMLMQYPTLLELFAEVVKVDPKALEVEYRTYMGGLKTDIDLILENDE